MYGLRIASLAATALAFALSLGAAPQEAEAARACPNIDGVPGKKCIKKKDLAKGVVNESRLSTGLQTHVNERESFYITLDGNNSTATIGTHGPLTYFVRCLLDVPDGGGGFDDKVEIVATSSVNGWFEEDESDSPTDNPPLAALQQVIVETETVDANGRAYDSLEETSAVAPGGFFLGIEGDTNGVGQNILNHDCIVTGYLLRITGTP